MTTPIFETLTPTNIGIVAGVGGQAQGFASDTDWSNSVFGHGAPAYSDLHFNPGQVQGYGGAAIGFATDIVGDAFVAGIGGAAVVYASDESILPSVNIVVGYGAQAIGVASGHSINLSTVIGYGARERVFATNLALPLVQGVGGAATGVILESIDYVANIYALQDPGFWYMTGDTASVRIQERLGLASTIQGHLTVVILEQLGLSSQTITLLEALMVVRESLSISDQLTTIFKVIVQERLGVKGTAVPTAIAVQTVIESLTLLGGVHSSLEARNVVTEALALNDALMFLAKERITEQLAFESAYADALLARNVFVEQLGLTGEVTPTARISVIIKESLGFQDSVSGLLEAFEKITEGLQFYATMALGDSVYQAWVCNTESEAFTEYTGFGFNSFMQFGGKYYGMTPDGVHLLEGPDDNGEKINARLRLGLDDLGSGKEKRMPALYLYVRNTGPLLIKAISTEPDGTLREDWYQLNPRGDGTGGVREARVKIGRGLKSVMWGWVVENIDGADLDLDGVKVFPMILDRRVRGSDG